MNASRSWVGVAVAAAVALVSVTGATSAPPNNSVADAQSVDVPAVIAATTDGAGLTKGDPLPRCAAVDGIVWYSVHAPRRGPMVATVKAGGRLDGAVAVYRILRSERHQIACAKTNRHGKAVVQWYGHREGSYLIGVARRSGAEDGPFRLGVRAAEPTPVPPGRELPAGGVRASVDPILDRADAWAVQMDRGTTYRINLTSPGNCLTLDIYRPETYRFRLAEPVRSHKCGGFSVFTPGIDGGGLYSFVVRAEGTKPVRHEYRLQVAASGIDDGSPGIKLVNGEAVAGKLFGRGVDVVDLFRFGVARPNELTTIELQEKANVGFDLAVLGETGEHVACACSARGPLELRQTLDPGRYFVAVRSRDQSGGKYSLKVLTREVTATSISANGSDFTEVLPDTSVSLAVQVANASHGGPVEIEIDRRDPLIGWQFSRVLTGNVDANGLLTISWTPPWVGYWRARARFLGTTFSTFSESRYVQVHVAEPLE